jgi:hypothetical protein
VHPEDSGCTPLGISAAARRRARPRIEWLDLDDRHGRRDDAARRERIDETVAKLKEFMASQPQA